MNIDLLNRVHSQLKDCYLKYGDYASFKESLAVLLEEVEELWAEGKKHKLDFERIESEIVDCITVLVKMHNDIVEKRNDR